MESWKIPLIAKGRDERKKNDGRPEEVPPPVSTMTPEGIPPVSEPSLSSQSDPTDATESPILSSTTFSHSNNQSTPNPSTLNHSVSTSSPSDESMENTRTPTDSPTVLIDSQTLSPTALTATAVPVSNNFTYPEATMPDITNASQAFVDRWCDLTGTDWFPKGSSAWKLRAPAFLIPGARYSGVHGLTELLIQHPQIRPPSKGAETSFFFDKTFQKYVKMNEKVTVMQARERLLASNYPALDFKKSPGMVSFDATSGYLFRSNVLPRRLMCVLPWIKLVIVLRDPVERVCDHYESLKASHNLPFDLESWIESDLELMRNANLIANTTNPTNKIKNKDEDTAWWQYHQRAREGPVGRSLYSIQLRHWLQTLRAVGRDPKKSVLIVRTEQLAQNPDKVYKRLLRFLDLADFEPSSWDAIAYLKEKKSYDIAKETIKLLRDFFQPYEEKLQSLLTRYKISYGLEEKDE
jgi:hypothetical protein